MSPNLTLPSTQTRLALKIHKLDRLDRRWRRRLALPESAGGHSYLEYWLTRGATHLGDSWVWLGLAFLLWRLNRPRPILRGIERASNPNLHLNRGRARVLGWLTTLFVTTGLVMFIKQTVQRPRPGADKLLYGGGPDQYSFPSGHAARMGVLAVWAPLYGRRAGWIVGLLALVVSWTRVRLGIHYVGDVAGGLLVGALLGLVGRIGRRTLYDEE